MPFIIIFVLIPFIELATFASVSEHIGIWTTLALAFLTAILGGLLVKYQGLNTILSMRKAIDQGKMPLDEIFDGFCLVAAGALLITPGFVTDAIGFALLVPPVRAALRYFIRTRTSWAVSGSTAEYETRQYRPHDGDIIEGDYERMDENEDQDRDEIKRL
ncbi:MAG TPA: FxsA family protein [Alphaproteobacteria bacterium]|nr:FxsA family protein [Alphaproteobacteria bacterium]USO05172.1 MAG: FxsA family protein [Rhodospirillales bacterium]HOO82104.1 FxsA family protein [Alphaproteobacteria bacterium]